MQCLEKEFEWRNRSVKGETPMLINSLGTALANRLVTIADLAVFQYLLEQVLYRTCSLLDIVTIVFGVHLHLLPTQKMAQHQRHRMQLRKWKYALVLLWLYRLCWIYAVFQISLLPLPGFGIDTRWYAYNIWLYNLVYLVTMVYNKAFFHKSALKL